MTSPHVVFMNIQETGHMNPSLPLVAELRARGCTVSYFVDASMQDVVESAGATWYPFRYAHGNSSGHLMALDEVGRAKYVPEGTPEEALKGLPNCLVYAAEAALPALLHDLRNLQPKPSIIVYDPFIASARVAGHVLQVPAVSLLTNTGPGSFPKPNEAILSLESRPWVEGPRQEILKQYGVDVFKDNMVMGFYSPTLNLVSTIDEFYAPPASSPLTNLQAQRFGNFKFLCVGAMVDFKVKRVGDSHKVEGKAADACEDSLLTDIDKALMEGRKLVYLSLGTVVTSRRLWSGKLAELGKPQGLENCTGKSFCQHVFRACFEALGGAKDIIALVSTGIDVDDALEGLPPLPANFMVRKGVPQLEVLKRAEAFITHGGANSMNEALRLKVPMAVVPVFGDQPYNAEAVARCGAGFAFLRPLESVTSKAMQSAINQLLQSKEHNSFREASALLSKKLEAACGPVTGADAIIDVATSSQGAFGKPAESSSKGLWEVFTRLLRNFSILC